MQNTANTIGLAMHCTKFPTDFSNFTVETTGFSSTFSDIELLESSGKLIAWKTLAIGKRFRVLFGDFTKNLLVLARCFLAGENELNVKNEGREEFRYGGESFALMDGEEVKVKSIYAPIVSRENSLVL